MMQKQESILIDFEFVCELVIIVIVEWWIQKYGNYHALGSGLLRKISFFKALFVCLFCMTKITSQDTIFKSILWCDEQEIYRCCRPIHLPIQKEANVLVYRCWTHTKNTKFTIVAKL